MSSLGSLLSTTGSTLGNAIGQGISSIASQSSGPVGRTFDQTSNRVSPNLLPQPGELWRMWTEGRIPPNTADWLLRGHGIDLFGRAERLKLFGQAWKQAFLQSTNQIPLDSIYRLVARRNLSTPDYERLLIRAGWVEPEVINSVKELRAPLIDLFTLWQLYNRKLIPAARYTAGLAELGWDVDGLAAAIDQLRYQIPPVSDIPRFMTRDVFDPRVVVKYDLDSEFNDKFQGRLKDWAAWQGVTDETMQAYWRAHWQFPSPTQLYEMLRRLRPERVPENIAVRPADVSDVLSVNDVPKYWRDRLIEISYQTLTRVDIRRMYTIGTIDREEVVHRYQDIGYDLPTAEILTKQADIDRVRGRNAQAKLMSVGEAVGLFGKFQLGEAVLRDVLFRNLIPPELIDQTIKDARQRRKSAIIGRCLAAYRKRYLTGLWTPGEAIAIVQQQGLEPDEAIEIVAGWQCEAAARGRVVPASTLCRWYESGLIDPAEYTARLVAVGYDPTDAARLLAACSRGISDKQRKAADASAARAKRELDKERKDAAKAKRQAELDAARGVKDASAERRKEEELAIKEKESAAKIDTEKAKQDELEAKAALERAKAAAEEKKQD